MDFVLKHLRVVDVGGYTPNCWGLCENFIYLIYINKRITMTTKGTHERLVETLSFLLFLS